MFSIGIGSVDQGLERETNEDNILIDNDLGLYIVVCDGMGGHAAGEVAADLAVRAT